MSFSSTSAATAGPQVASALEHLKRASLLFKVLGSYPEAVL